MAERKTVIFLVKLLDYLFSLTHFSLELSFWQTCVGGLVEGFMNVNVQVQGQS